MPQQVLYTINEAAEYLRVDRATIYRMMKAGTLGYVLVGQRRRIPIEALEAVITKGRGGYLAVDPVTGRAVPAAKP